MKYCCLKFEESLRRDRRSYPNIRIVKFVSECFVNPKRGLLLGKDVFHVSEEDLKPGPSKYHWGLVNFKRRHLKSKMECRQDMGGEEKYLKIGRIKKGGYPPSVLVQRSGTAINPSSSSGLNRLSTVSDSEISQDIISLTSSFLSNSFICVESTQFTIIDPNDSLMLFSSSGMICLDLYG